MISGKILRDAIISGANNINNQRSRVDELNVFPVPDGDTGTNMGMTVGAAVRELQAMDDSCTVGEAAKTAASAMLRGARGNSGVITSLLFRGFSKALEGKKEADAADIVAALQKGVEGAYKAVMKPTEGTILTVARIASEEAAACGKEDVAELWDVVMTAGQKALEDTPNLLPVLKKAGVVDAGGQGIMIIFEGMGKVFHGEDMVAGGEAVPNKAKLSTENAGKGVFTDDLMKVEDIKNGYCTQFLINKNEGASAAKMRAFAESNGDSVVCIEDDDVINLHVHTADPGKILSEAIKYGYLTNFKIENMHEQFLARQKQGKSLEKQASAEKKPDPASEFVYAAVDPSRDYGFVAVAAGEGPGHHVELHRGVHHRVPLGLDAPLPQHIFQGHLRHAAGPAPDDGPAPDVLPGEGPRLPAHQEGAVPLGQLGKDHGMVLLALVHHIDGGLRPGQAHVRLAGHNGGHDLVGAAAIGQLHLQPLLAEEALAHGHILRRVEHRVGDLAQAHPGQLFFPGAARQDQQRRQTKTQYDTDFFHALTPQ